MADGPLTTKGIFFTRLTIAGVEVGTNYLVGFEWSSFVNGGYIIRGKISDVGQRILRSKGIIDEYLKNARRIPYEIKFRLGYPGGKQTNERIAILSDMNVYGTPDSGEIEFIGVDPPSWYLNAGLGDGKVYKGRVSDVIEKVVNEYAPKINVSVTKTIDDPNGRWAMMRQDPQTFIQSLLDWSAELTPSKTNWMVASVDNKIVIKEQADLISERIHYGDYIGSPNHSRKNDIFDYDLINSTIITAYQDSIVTQGISAVSGKFLDKQTEEKKMVINDDNTSNKANARTDQRKAFKKPKSKWATSIISVPELSGGEIGVKYEDWLAGRARNLYITMLPQIMRIRLTIDGDPIYDDSSKLGVSTININWKDVDGDDYFLAGRWLVYGFHHRFRHGLDPRWLTDVYAYRIDYDANAKQL